MNRFRIAAAALLLGAPTVVFGQENDEAPICTDRPGKGNGVCTVPAGKWQVESQPVDWIRLEADGAETDVWTLGSSVLKLGLSDRSDLQVAIAPWVHAETKAGVSKVTASGFGDLTVRYKHRLTGDGSPVQVGLIPFIKLPTADSDIGNGKAEGGIAIPVSVATRGPLSITFGPELDLLADADGNGRHAALVNLVNVSGPVADGLTLSGELWTATNFDPADTVTFASADAALAYAASNEVQLDVGANIGLNKNTSDVELYAGISVRF